MIDEIVYASVIGTTACHKGHSRWTAHADLAVRIIKHGPRVRQHFDVRRVVRLLLLSVRLQLGPQVID